MTLVKTYQHYRTTSSTFFVPPLGPSREDAGRPSVTDLCPLHKLPSSHRALNYSESRSQSSELGPSSASDIFVLSRSLILPTLFMNRGRWSIALNGCMSWDTRSEPLDSLQFNIVLDTTNEHAETGLKQQKLTTYKSALPR